MSSHSLSVILIVKNEADRVERCLQSVASLADEIIVLDSGSTDDTVNICKKYTDKVSVTDWPGFGKQKQRALDQASCEWVLSIDADEALDDTMQQAIKSLMNQEHIDKVAYRLPWGVTLYGKTLHYGRSARSVLRLFKREGAHFTLDEVHETVVPCEAGKNNGKKYAGKGELKQGYLLHFTHRDYGHGLSKAADYAWLGSQKYHRKGRKSFGLLLALMRGLWTFIHVYILRLGFLDGSVGFIMAMIYAQVSYNKYVGLWLLEKGR